jgi:hypothetical protein
VKVCHWKFGDFKKANPAFRLQTVLALQTWQDKMGVKNYAGQLGPPMS